MTEHAIDFTPENFELLIGLLRPRRKGGRLRAVGVVADTSDWSAGEFPGRDGAIEKNSPDTRACVRSFTCRGHLLFRSQLGRRSYSGP